MDAPTLHHLSSSQSLRVLWALEELSAAGHPFEYKLEKYSRVAQRAPPSLKTVFPLGKSPVLVVPSTTANGPAPIAESGNGELKLAESTVILHFLADEYSDGLWKPSTPEDRFRDAYWAEFANASIGQTLTVALIFELIPMQAPGFLRPLLAPLMRAIVGKIKGEIVPMWDLMEKALSGKPWFAGSKIGVADFSMSWPMDLCTHRGWFGAEEAKKYPNVKGWVERVHEREAYKKALEKGGVYDLKGFT